MAARERQQQRAGKPNATLAPSEIEHHCSLDSHGSRLLQDAIQRLGLSARAYHRILKVARTVADLAGQTEIAAAHVAEAVQYRTLDRGSETRTPDLGRAAG